MPTPKSLPASVSERILMNGQRLNNKITLERDMDLVFEESKPETRVGMSYCFVTGQPVVNLHRLHTRCLIETEALIGRQSSCRRALITPVLCKHPLPIFYMKSLSASSARSLSFEMFSPCFDVPLVILQILFILGVSDLFLWHLVMGIP